MRQPPNHDTGCLPRRGFLKAGAAALGSGLLVLSRSADSQARPETELTIGVFTDSHFADREPAINRYYRDSAEKLAECVRTLAEAKPAFAICLGDLVDKGKTVEQQSAFVKQIEAVFRKFDGPRHHVIGNHDVATLTKDQFAAATAMPAPHYSFDGGPFHFVVLDANYRKDFEPYRAGNFDWTDTWVPPDEQRWLAADLKATERKTIVFVHQPLDDEKGAHGVKNAPDVRRLLEASGKVLAVFSGHNHRGAFHRISGIPYFTLRAMVEGPGLENNAFALVRVSADGAVHIRGYGKQGTRNSSAG